MLYTTLKLHATRWKIGSGSAKIIGAGGVGGGSNAYVRLNDEREAAHVGDPDDEIEAESDEESRELFGAAQQASLALNPPDQIGKVSKAAFVHVAAEAGLTARGGGADLTSRSMRRAA